MDWCAMYQHEAEAVGAKCEADLRALAEGIEDPAAIPSPEQWPAIVVVPDPDEFGQDDGEVTYLGEAKDPEFSFGQKSDEEIIADVARLFKVSDRVYATGFSLGYVGEVVSYDAPRPPPHVDHMALAANEIVSRPPPVPTSKPASEPLGRAMRAPMHAWGGLLGLWGR